MISAHVGGMPVEELAPAAVAAVARGGLALARARVRLRLRRRPRRHG